MPKWTNPSYPNARAIKIENLMNFTTLKCDYCERQMPNKNWKTKNGCKWCDVDYRRKDGHK